MLGQFAARRRILLEGFKAIPGLKIAEPLGAFYLFPNISAFSPNSSEVADYLLSEHGIATVAGSVFGSAGEGHIRIAYSCSTDECARGVDRLAEAWRPSRRAARPQGFLCHKLTTQGKLSIVKGYFFPLERGWIRFPNAISPCFPNCWRAKTNLPCCRRIMSIRKAGRNSSLYRPDIGRPLLSNSRIEGFEHLSELYARALKGESCLLLVEHYSNFDLPVFHYLLRKQGDPGKAIADTIVSIAGIKLSESNPAVNAFAKAYTRLVIYPSRSLEIIKNALWNRGNSITK
jgi:hypothetical protein